MVIVVGTDAPAGNIHKHKSPKSFTKRVDRILNEDTVEGVHENLEKDDKVIVLVPESMADERVEELREYGKEIKNYEVKKTDAEGIVETVEEQGKGEVKGLYFFGHGTKDAPIYDYGNEAFPDAEEFTKESFSGDAVAGFETCNSKEYAEDFTEETEVTSIGTEGTTYYGEETISAGRLTKSSNPGTSKAWVFNKETTTDKKTGKAKKETKSFSFSLSSKRGEPFLLKKPRRDPFAKPKAKGSERELKWWPKVEKTRK